MQLSLTKVERCEKLLTSSIALAAANAGPRSSIYNRPQNRFSEFNETIWECHDNYYLDAATLSHLLQFGTVIRRGEGRLVSLAAGIFTALKTLLAKKQTRAFIDMWFLVELAALNSQNSGTLGNHLFGLMSSKK